MTNTQSFLVLFLNPSPKREFVGNLGISVGKADPNTQISDFCPLLSLISGREGGAGGMRGVCCPPLNLREKGG